MAKVKCKACQDCGSSAANHPVLNRAIMCLNQEASQSGRFPDATRHCTGYHLAEVATASDTERWPGLFVKSYPDGTARMWEADPETGAVGMEITNTDGQFAIGGSKKWASNLARSALAYYLGSAMASAYTNEMAECLMKGTGSKPVGFTKGILVKICDGMSGHIYGDQPNPDRCSACGQIKRPDGRNLPCPKKDVDKASV